MSATAIRKAYGFDFPPDLEELRRATAKHRAALHDAGLTLAGPLALPAKAAAGTDLGRWPADPPELFTVVDGDMDGLHFGYVLHAPGEAKGDGGYVVQFYARDGYPIEGAAPTLSAAIHAYVDGVARERRDELAATRAVGEEDRELGRAIQRMEALVAALAPLVGKRQSRPAAVRKGAEPTLDGLGVRAPKTSFVALDRKKLHAGLRDVKKRGAWLARGHALVEEKKAGSALVIARDALAILPTKDQDAAVVLARAAYEALGRPLLARTFEARLPGITERLAGTVRAPRVDNRHAHSMKDALLAPKNVRALVLERWGAQSETPDLDAIAALPSLELLVLRGYRLDDLPASFAKLKKLEAIELFECALGALPKVLARLPKLRRLKIIQDSGRAIPKKRIALAAGLAFPRLEALSLVGCGLDAVPPFVTACKKLTNLGLGWNRLKELPEAIAALSRLRYLSLEGNGLTELPESLASLTHLASLWLDRNKLAALPDALAALPLESLALGSNPLVKDKAERARIKRLAPKAKIFWA